MKIAIYGGTFNPPHQGHTSLAESLIQQGLADEVWLLVSPLNPLKQANTAEFAPYEDRLRMTEIAVQNLKGLRASDFENHLPRPSYMIHTLNALTQAYPQHQFSLVIGADNWQRFSDWYKSEEIIANYHILVYRRPGYNISVPFDTKNVQMVDTPLYDISSTQIRHAVRTNSQTSNLSLWLSPSVLEYMNKHNLYMER